MRVVLLSSYTDPQGRFPRGSEVELPETVALDLLARKFAYLPGEPAPDLSVEDHSLAPEPEAEAKLETKKQSARPKRKYK